MGMHPPINPIRSRWIRPASGPLWTHLLEVPLLDQKELDLGHDKTDLKSSGSAIILFYVAVCQPDHIYTRYVPCISFERSCILNIRNIIHVEDWFFKPDIASLSTSCDNLILSYWLSAKPDIIACDHYNLFLLVVAASRLC